jgi:GT2 family glycosyltransferase
MSQRRDSRIAVVMITHNRRDETLRSLACFERLPERPQIVVVDNGSTDGTAEAIGAAFPSIEVISAGGNLGAAARNLGVERVAAPYVALADDDTWWEPGCLSHAADLFDAHPRLGIVTGRVLVGREELEDPVCTALEQSPLPRLPEMPGPPLLGFLAGASAVRRCAFLEAGGFQSRLFLGGEEEILAADVVSLGWWICYVPRLVVHHYPSPHRDAETRHVHLTRNSLWFAWLRRPVSVALRRTWQAGLAGVRDPLARRAFGEAIAGLPWVLPMRRAVPTEVEASFRLLGR